MAEDYSDDVVSDQDSEYEGDDEQEQELGAIDIEAANLVTELAASEEGQKYLREYRYKVQLEYELAKDSNERYLEGVASDLSIFYGQLPPKKPPFENMANLNIPIALENISRLINRAEGELFGDWTNVFGVAPLGTNDRDAAELISRHGNWQISTQIPDFKRQQRRGMLLYFLVGDVTFESYWDPVRKCNRHEALSPEEFYTPYINVSVMPDWSDAPYRGRIYDYYRHDMEAFYGIWDSDALDKVLSREAEWDASDEHPSPIRTAIAKLNDEELPSDGPAPYRVLRHETWCKLPGHPTERLVRITMDLSSGVILHMSLHELPMSWEDLGRYEMQVDEYKRYIAAREQFEMAIGAQEAGGGTGSFLGAPLPQEPPMPSWMTDPDDEPRKPDKVPLHQYSHAVNIEPLMGGKGIGFGKIQADINRFANTALNQHTDAATLGNYPGLFADASAQLPKRVPLGGGVVTNVRTDGTRSVSDMIHVVQMARDTGSLLELVKWGQEVARSGIQSPEVLSGEPGKSGESARGLMARIGEATKQLAVSTRAYSDQALTSVLLHNARLNAIHMPKVDFFLVNDERGSPQMAEIGRQAYRRVPFIVQIRADLKFTADVERIAEADALVGMALNIPVLQGNAAFLWEALRRALEARGQGDMVALLGPAPEGPPPAMDQAMAQMQAMAQAQQAQAGRQAPQPQQPQQQPGPGPGEAAQIRAANQQAQQGAQ